MKFTSQTFRTLFTKRLAQDPDAVAVVDGDCFWRWKTSRLTGMDGSIPAISAIWMTRVDCVSEAGART